MYPDFDGKLVLIVWYNL